jgi:pyruvate dehydrogenase (quinone)/pyruvate oxidase
MAQKLLWKKEECCMWSGWEISRTVSRHLVEQLKAWGVKQVYGVIGDANAPFFDELGKQEEIKLIPCRSEMAAALMASAEAKLTGRPAVCTATSGPGAALLLAGLGDAAADRVPVLAVTGQVERHKLGTGSKQEMDQQLLFASVADYSVLVAGGKGFPEQLNLAMKTAVARAGVAHLSIPKDVWKEKAEGLLFPFPETAPLPRPEKERIRAAVELIDQSERPVILAGRGVKQAAEAVLRLAERIQAPLIVTMPEHGLIPQDHPWFVGGLGQAGSEAATELLLETDLCLVLGATWWPEAFVPKSVPVIQVDAVPENIGLRFPCKAAVVGDMREAVAALLESTRVKNDESRARRVAD